MSILDLLKEVPLSAVLKEKIAALEAENKALKAENAVLKEKLASRKSSGGHSKKRSRKNSLIKTPTVVFAITAPASSFARLRPDETGETGRNQI
jgi:regulator of replication initiation timing